MGVRNSRSGPTGWLAIDKPPGLGSTSVVSRVRRAFQCRRVGHAGTLDRPASGVLAVALGEATKTVSHVMDSDKCYRFTVIFGIGTSTDDATGDVISRCGIRPSDTEIESALTLFQGDIVQVPPAFSSVKVDGRRAHEYARGGENVELRGRPLHVSRLVMLERVSRDVASFEMVCGKGGYVRSIARDLGSSLGCHGHVHELKRVRSGPFGLEDCISIDMLETAGNREELHGLLTPIETVLGHLPVHECTEDERVRILNGNSIRPAGQAHDKWDACWLSYHGRAIALARAGSGMIRPRRIIHLEP